MVVEPSQLPSNRDANGPGPDVGEFRQGSPASRWALARLLVGSAVLDAIGRTFYLVAGAMFVFGVLLWAFVTAWLGAPVVLASFVVLGLRVMAGTAVRSLTGVVRRGPGGTRLRALVSDTGGDVRRELRRIGLPGHTWTLPLLAARLIGPRRAQTLARLSQFDVGRAVPASRLDELHLLIQRGGRLR